MRVVADILLGGTGSTDEVLPVHQCSIIRELDREQWRRAGNGAHRTSIDIRALQLPALLAPVVHCSKGLGQRSLHVLNDGGHCGHERGQQSGPAPLTYNMAWCSNASGMTHYNVQGSRAAPTTGLASANCAGAVCWQGHRLSMGATEHAPRATCIGCRMPGMRDLTSNHLAQHCYGFLLAFRRLNSH